MNRTSDRRLPHAAAMPAILLAVAAWGGTVPGGLLGQTAPEPILDQVRSVLAQEGFTFGMLLQAVLDPALDGDDSDPASVQVAAARILISGSLDGGSNISSRRISPRAHRSWTRGSAGGRPMSSGSGRVASSRPLVASYSRSPGPSIS